MISVHQPLHTKETLRGPTFEEAAWSPHRKIRGESIFCTCALRTPCLDTSRRIYQLLLDSFANASECCMWGIAWYGQLDFCPSTN